MDIKECPMCGCKEIGQGTMSPVAQMMPLHGLWSSDIMADICTNCGYIISMKVKEPKNFK